MAPANLQLVLSLYPGIDLLGRAFEAEGFCVVRGPDHLWGGEMKNFHVPEGKFDGVIGGPPCKGESSLAYLNGKPGVTERHEFMRVVCESACRWWVMEAVKEHWDLGEDEPISLHVIPLNNRWLGAEQNRLRFFHTNLALRKFIKHEVFEPLYWKHAVLAGHGGAKGTIQRRMAKYHWQDACGLQGLSRDFDLPGFTARAKYEALGNGVPLPMGLVIARAVKASLAVKTNEGA